MGLRAACCREPSGRLVGLSRSAAFWYSDDGPSSPPHLGGGLVTYIAPPDDLYCDQPGGFGDPIYGGGVIFPPAYGGTATPPIDQVEWKQFAVGKVLDGAPGSNPNLLFFPPIPEDIDYYWNCFPEIFAPTHEIPPAAGTMGVPAAYAGHVDGPPAFDYTADLRMMWIAGWWRADEPGPGPGTAFRFQYDYSGEPEPLITNITGNLGDIAPDPGYHFPYGSEFIDTFFEITREPVLIPAAAVNPSASVEGTRVTWRLRSDAPTDLTELLLRGGADETVYWAVRVTEPNSQVMTIPNVRRWSGCCATLAGPRTRLG